MNLLYVDIDSLRPDRLGCYGCARATSPNIDRLAAEGVRFGNCYAPDVPCLPSRTSLFSGLFGIHHGAVNHGGARAEPFGDGEQRRFRPSLARTSWPAVLREAGLRTVTISSFADRHGAWHIHAGFDETFDPGGRGHESADAVTPTALDWLTRNAKAAPWFLHVNLWDVHVPHRPPEAFRGRPAGGGPSWLSEEVLREHWSRPGLRSAQDPMTLKSHADQPTPFDSLGKVRALWDNYDAAVRYADAQAGLLLDAIERLGVADETIVVVSADHGECLGELNCYGGHCLADHWVGRVPMIVRDPASCEPASRQDDRLCYPFDVTAAVSRRLGAKLPNCWDAAPLCETGAGREYLVVSQLAQAAQRSVRFDADGAAWLFVRTWHDGFTGLPERMLFDLTHDPHELTDLAAVRTNLAAAGERLLDEWTEQMLATSPNGDPLATVLAEGPEMVRGRLETYAERLRQTGRSRWADELIRRHRRREAR